MKKQNLLKLAVAGVLAVGAQGAWAASACSDLVKAATGGSTSVADFATAVQNDLKASRSKITTGASNNAMWLTLMANDGTVCAVVSGATEGKATAGGTGVGTGSWLLSRVISAQKANTANGLSTNTASIPSGALYGAASDGGSLFGVQFSNPVDTAVAYKGSDSTFGTKSDPLKNKRIGGVNVFGGGVPLYDGSFKVGAIGVSGDTSCEDQAVAFNIRSTLGLVPAFDDKISLSGSAHPNCGDATLGTGGRNGKATGFKS